MTVPLLAAGGACAATGGAYWAALRLWDGSHDGGNPFPLEISHEEYAPRPAIDAWAERKAATIRWRQHRGALPALAVLDCWEIVLGWVITAARQPAPLYDEAAWADYVKGAA